ncbi:hypothetical protein [Alistipes sp. CHKCI003]|uniref:hypothetical protein n=1 Tax=Alistipes sp. CHKCI003 TaxID=1780376 RepID=UPI0007A80852|nr:hypothetical protein BN3659_02284 [Alistipes sp. CHKCI003]
MRITVNKRAAEVMIKRSISVELWNQKKGMLQGKRPCSHRTEPLYQYGSCQSIAIHRGLEIDNKPITAADIIKDCFYGRDKVQRSLLEVYAEHDEKCRALIGKEYTANIVIQI